MSGYSSYKTEMHWNRRLQLVAPKQNKTPFASRQWKKAMIRISLLMTCLIVASAFTTCKNCNAQRIRGLFRNHRTIQRPLPQHQMQTNLKAKVTDSRSGHGHSTVFPTASYFAEQRSPFFTRLIDGKMTQRYRDPREVDSRYVGGFHESHFYNLGIPNGDIGLRGNGLNFRPW